MNPDGTSDVNIVGVFETSNNQTLNFDVIDGSPGTAALKVTSHATNVKINANHLIGGSENCVDLNNECQNITLDCATYEIKGKYGISAKTCTNVTFIGHLIGKPSQWHVNLGSYSDQSSATQEHTSLILTADSYPIIVWCGNSTKPSLDDASKYRIIGFGQYGPFVRWICMFFWKLGKKLHLA